MMQDSYKIATVIDGAYTHRKVHIGCVCSCVCVFFNVGILVHVLKFSHIYVRMFLSVLACIFKFLRALSLYINICMYVSKPGQVLLALCQTLELA